MDCCDHTICMSCAVPGFPESCPSCGKCIKSVLPVGYHKVGRRGKDSLEYDSIDILENTLSSVTIMNDGIKTTIRAPGDDQIMVLVLLLFCIFAMHSLTLSLSFLFFKFLKDSPNSRKPKEQQRTKTEEHRRTLNK